MISSLVKNHFESISKDSVASEGVVCSVRTPFESRGNFLLTVGGDVYCIAFHPVLDDAGLKCRPGGGFGYCNADKFFNL